ncbi:ankyrin repeat-containing domain protein [Podospora didyma]|uniref:Ankyrin repeat-containing domain protein n=1 Tax=Podospora didyma TaxID=330526 RepID=A0AAE0NR37_9PEZI|nr:ankyrin repeat-containing domain protein [Podospora didyma]
MRSIGKRLQPGPRKEVPQCGAKVLAGWRWLGQLSTGGGARRANDFMFGYRASLRLTEIGPILVAHGAELDAVDHEGKTPLMLAVLANYSGPVFWLIEQGAAIDVVGTAGRTALRHAVLAGRSWAVSWLLEKGAAIDAMDNDGRTALYHAARNCDPSPALAGFRNEEDALRHARFQDDSDETGSE